MKRELRAYALGGAVLALSVGAAFPALAQDRRAGNFAPGPRHAMVGGEAPWISIALRHKAELNLSADQVANLERIRTDFQNRATPIGQQLRTLESELNTVLQQSPANLVLARTKIEQAEKLRSELRYLRIEALENGKSVLSAQQRDQLKALFAARHQGNRKPPAGQPS
jgi:Spy/CpxP family protein refolding chaperone